jgi:hypothetical protein
MIRHLDPPTTLVPNRDVPFQIAAAVGAGLIAGLILLMVPRGSPWSSLTFFAPVVLGRVIPPDLGLSLPATWLIHLALSLVYGVLVSRAVAHVTQLRALITGGIVGLVLYLPNFAVVAARIPELRDNEVSVIFTHVVFGMIAAGAYRGLLKRRTLPAEPAHPVNI